MRARLIVSLATLLVAAPLVIAPAYSAGGGGGIRVAGKPCVIVDESGRQPVSHVESATGSGRNVQGRRSVAAGSGGECREARTRRRGNPGGKRRAKSGHHVGCESPSGARTAGRGRAVACRGVVGRDVAPGGALRIRGSRSHQSENEGRRCPPGLRSAREHTVLEWHCFCVEARHPHRAPEQLMMLASVFAGCLPATDITTGGRSGGPSSRSSNSLRPCGVAWASPPPRGQPDFYTRPATFNLVIGRAKALPYERKAYPRRAAPPRGPRFHRHSPPMAFDGCGGHGRGSRVGPSSSHNRRQQRAPCVPGQS